MRQARLVTFGVAFALAAALVACSGGGGSNTPAVSAPANPGAPSMTTPPPSKVTTPPSTSTTPPSNSTTVPPSTTTTPPSRVTTPPSTSTTPPSTSTTPPSTATLPPSIPGSSAVIHIGYGQTNGASPEPLLVSSASNTRGYQHGGDYMPGDPGAMTTGGQNGSGGQGATVDGIPCNPTMSEIYHVHFFLGVYDNGTEEVVPAGLGMVNPNPPDQYIVN